MTKSYITPAMMNGRFPFRISRNFISSELNWNSKICHTDRKHFHIQTACLLTRALKRQQTEPTISKNASKMLRITKSKESQQNTQGRSEYQGQHPSTSLHIVSPSTIYRQGRVKQHVKWKELQHNSKKKNHCLEALNQEYVCLNEQYNSLIIIQTVLLPCLSNEQSTHENVILNIT